MGAVESPNPPSFLPPQANDTPADTGGEFLGVVGPAATADVPTVQADGSVAWKPGGGGSALTVEQGATVVTPVTTIKFTSGATVTDAGGGEADVAVSGGSSGSSISASVATFLSGSDPSAIAFLPDSSKGYVTDSSPTERVTVFNPATAEVITRIALPPGSGPLGCACSPDGATVWVACYGFLQPINTADDTLGTPITMTPSDTGHVAITPNGHKAYVTGYATAAVYTADLVGLAQGPTIDLSGLGAALVGIAITPDGTKAYVVDTNNGTIVPIDLSNDTPGSPFLSMSAPFWVGITPDGATAYAPDTGNGLVYPIDVATDTPGSAITLSDNPWGVCFSPDGATAYVSIRASALYKSRVQVIDVGSGTPGIDYSLGANATAEFIGAAPDGKVFACNIADGTVAALVRVLWNALV